MARPASVACLKVRALCGPRALRKRSPACADSCRYGASWGTLVFEGSKQLVVYPWILVGPGLALSITIFSLNVLGDGLRDALDPQARGG